MDDKFLEKIDNFAGLAKEILVQALESEEGFGKLDKNWQEFFEKCANVVNAYDNLPKKQTPGKQANKPLEMRHNDTLFWKGSNFGEEYALLVQRDKDAENPRS